MDNRLLPPKDQFRPDREPPRAIEPRTYAYEPQACLPSSARPTWPGPWMCAGVRDRPVRRLLAWLLTLSAWEACEPQSGGVFRRRDGRLSAPFGGRAGGVGARRGPSS